MHTDPPMRRQLGLSIIELMISLTLSLVVLSALIYIYVGSRGTYRGNEAVARIQENGRFAMDWLSREIRSAGFFGCVSRGLTPVIIADGFTGFSMGLQAVAGAENGSGWTDAPSNYLRGDVLYLSGMYGSSANVLDTSVGAKSSNPINANVKVDRCIGLNQYDLVLATNCARATILRVTNDPEKGSCPPTSGSNTVTDANNNNTDDFRLDPPYTVQQRAILYKFFAFAYFVGTNPAGRPALYRYSSGYTTKTGEKVNVVNEEVVENIENMDLLFGEDTTGTGNADVYRPASEVTNWANVVSARVTLVAVSPDTGATAQSQTYYFGANNDGTAVDWLTVNDRRLRQVFTSTVALRNRLP